MKIIATAAALSALALASQVSASPLEMDIYTVGNAAHVTVTENGQPAAGIPISVEGLTSRTIKTSAQGSAIIQNYNNNASTYTFSIKQADGSTITTKRLLSRQH
ncbi:hypothetical protein [Vibrio salinus]|uniref:hypothetical protein n=1 Tax=Vibrio salinus TaxID=2899784 RepID=UPI001E40F14A|nr:hypothetical protein [Vibrio salinus]MCE0494870.1 hypothetical protein [Vibrio salinus]